MSSRNWSSSIETPLVIRTSVKPDVSLSFIPYRTTFQESGNLMSTIHQ
jgi:hypothetical protein